jgi:hypothetical protein
MFPLFMFEHERFVESVGPFVFENQLRRLLVLATSSNYEIRKHRVFLSLGWDGRLKTPEYVRKIDSLEASLREKPDYNLYRYCIIQNAISGGDFAKAAEYSFSDYANKLLMAEKAVSELPFKCKHPVFIDKYSKSMEELPDDVGNLRYDALRDFLDGIAKNIAMQAKNDRERGRNDLSTNLDEASNKIMLARNAIDVAFKISRRHIEI